MLRWTWRFLLQSLVPSGRGRGPMAVGRLRNILFIWPDAAVGKNGDFSTNLGRKHPALNSTKHRRWTAIQERERKRDLAWDVLSSVGAFMHGKSMSMGSLFSMCFTYGLNMFESNSYSVCIICYHMLSSHAKLGSIEQKHAKPVKWTYFCCPMLLEAFGIPSSYHTCVNKTQTNRPSIRCQSRWTTSEDDGPKPEKKAAEVGKTAGSDWCNYIIIYNHAVCVI